MIKSFAQFFCILALSMATIAAQDQEDLSLPGDEAPVVVNTGADTAASSEGADQERESLFDLIRDGGWAMIPLVVMLFAVIGLGVYLMLDLTRKTFLPPQLVTSLQASADAGDLNAISEKAKEDGSCLGQVMYGACDYIYDHGYQVLDGDSIYDLMADATQEFNRRRVSLLNYLSVISQAAPMVGLLGTVSGMIKAFATLKQSGMGDPGQLAGNISEALVTTASGLIVALPAIFAFFFFRDKLVARVAEVDKRCSQILNALRRAVLGGHHPHSGHAPEEVPPHHPEDPPAQQPHPLA